ncbi:MAG: thiol reductant ABC exporter subunit CydC [Sporolactobacillus sp.]
MKTWMIPYAERHWKGMLLSVILGVLAAVCAAGLLFTSGYLISKAALRPENILLIYVPVVGVRAFGIFRAVFQYSTRLVSHDTILRMLSEMRITLYKKLEPMALHLRSRYRTGDLLGVLSDDIEHLQDVYLRTIIPAASAVLIYVLWIAMIGGLDSLFGFFAALYLLIILLLFPFLSLVMTRRRRESMLRHRHRLYETLTDAVLGIGDWMLSGRQSAFLASHETEEKKAAAANRWLHDFHNIRDFLSQLVFAAFILAVLYWSGGMARHGQISPTLIAAFVLILFPIGEALLPVAEAVERSPQYQEAFRRLNGIALNETHFYVSETEQVNDGATREAVICLQHLAYRYQPDDNWAVNDLSLTIEQGKRIALIGRSGAGKSTLIQLIYGSLIPTCGSVTLGGVPCQRFGRAMASRISVLNQNPHLFDTTVLNNISLGNREASEADVIAAAKAVGLHETIMRLAQGYQTQMHEAGDIFSGGEQERLALARILLQDNPIVILDEPTVGLDPITEKTLLQTIFSLLKGRTLIWITHHLTGTEQMDQILFMEQGTIEMQGTHAELLERYPRYRRLYALDVPQPLREALATQDH